MTYILSAYLILSVSQIQTASAAATSLIKRFSYKRCRVVQLFQLNQKVLNGNMQNKLTKIPNQKLKNLRDMFKVDWPKHIVSYSTICTFMRKLERNPEYSKEVEIFSLNGNWKQDGTFVIHLIESHYVMLGSLDNKAAYTILSLLNFEIPLKFPCIDVNFKSMISDLTVDRMSMNHNLTKCYHLSKEQVLNFEWTVPEDLEMRSLTKSDAKSINSLWPHRFPGSDEYLKNLIVHNISVGLFKKETNEVVAWVLWTDMGAIGVLQVTEAFQGRGLAAILVKALSSLAVTTYNVDVTAHIYPTNIPSLSLFTKLGFREIHENSKIELVENKNS